MSNGNSQFLWFVGAFVAGGALVWMGRPCPECSVPADNSAKMDSVIAVANAANARADSVLALPVSKPVTVRIHERLLQVRGARRDSLEAMLDAMPSAE